jgi:hypothetical protein
MNEPVPFAVAARSDVIEWEHIADYPGSRSCNMIWRHLVIAVVVLAACDRGRETTTDSAAAEADAISIATPQRIPATTGNPCEHTGQWAACSLERRLKQSGFVVRKLDEKPARAGFTIEPIVYSLGSSRLEVFIYPDEKALAKDIESLDTLAVAPRGSTAAWPSTPTLIRSANLAAVLLSQNQRQAERVVLAITAGPPQPGSPR